MTRLHSIQKGNSMKYLFSFNEVNHGCVEIESDRCPNSAEIIDSIVSGKAQIHSTDYIGFSLIGKGTPELPAPARERAYER